eukprot:6488711-Amphidinium_carterae.3
MICSGGVQCSEGLATTPGRRGLLLKVTQCMRLLAMHANGACKQPRDVWAKPIMSLWSVWHCSVEFAKPLAQYLSRDHGLERRRLAQSSPCKWPGKELGTLKEQNPNLGHDKTAFKQMVGTSNFSSLNNIAVVFLAC